MLLILLGAVGYIGFRYWKTRDLAASIPIVGSVPENVTMAPVNVRIKVEVINATTVRGLGRRATIYLRDRGFDVVGISTSREVRDSTLVLNRSGHADWAALIGKAFNAKVESRPDSSRYVDVTVLIGANWRPPALPFYP
ncbi:MAG: LytR C-terminal domain-containing protein [Gemmatimonadaceae bacterium]|nr:LytR C-terminal domain-containing protein [Gemmatimonadaceae bacterium]